MIIFLKIVILLISLHVYTMDVFNERFFFLKFLGGHTILIRIEHTPDPFMCTYPKNFIYPMLL